MNNRDLAENIFDSIVGFLDCNVVASANSYSEIVNIIEDAISDFLTGEQSE